MASCLPMNGRQKVLIGGLDFPTVGHQWLSRPDVEVEFVPSVDGSTVPPEAFTERIDESVALVATTHLFYTTGYVQDVRAIADAAHRAGALLLVDGYQSVGCLPISVEDLGCDVFIGGCLKWLSGGPGTAFTYVRPDLIPSLRPIGTGWFATPDPFSFTLQDLEFAPDARRFEAGTYAVAAHMAALAALELILEVGVENICERLRDFSDRILERCDEEDLRVFTPGEREQRVGVVTIESERPDEVEARLHAADVIIDSRPGRIRLSPHWALSESDLERGLDLVIQQLAGAAL
jgi:selenocysteine lyase/cysteine desulfurase